MSRICRIFLTLSTVSLSWLIAGAKAEDRGVEWEELSGYHKVALDQILQREAGQVLLYYIDRAGLAARRLNLNTNEMVSVGLSGHEKFVCLIEHEDHQLQVSACQSANGSVYASDAYIASSPIFADQVELSQVDKATILVDGTNKNEADIYHLYFRLPDLLQSQTIGEGDIAASCSTLQLTSSDGIGAVNIFKTSLRPHIVATYTPIPHSDPRSQLIKLVHLKVDAGQGYQCDEAVTLPSGLILILSGDQLVLIYPATSEYAVGKLPVPNHGYALVRVVR